MEGFSVLKAHMMCLTLPVINYKKSGLSFSTATDKHFALSNSTVLFQKSRLHRVCQRLLRCGFAVKVTDKEYSGIVSAASQLLHESGRINWLVGRSVPNINYKVCFINNNNNNFLITFRFPCSHDVLESVRTKSNL